MTLEPDIRVVLSDDQKIQVDHDRIVQVAMRTARSEGAHGEISITLVDEDCMAGLHLEYMNEPGPTDVLSFPIDGLPSGSETDGPSWSWGPPLEPAATGAARPPLLLGEVVICPAVARRAGPDLASELDLLAAHGVLHLLGHDHDDDRGAERMRAVEKKVTGRSGARAP